MSLKSAVYGFAVGDALGVPHEFKERGTFHCEGMNEYGTHQQPKGTWSDDTSMVIATCDSIKQNKGKINVEDIAYRFWKWLFQSNYNCNGTVFDVGNTTHAAMQKWSEVQDASISGRTGEFDNGNGGLMRILPLAYVFGVRISELFEVCGITHNTELSQRACLIYTDAIVEAEEYKKITDIELNYYATFPGFERLAELPNLTEDQIKSTGFVVDTLEAALWCFVTTDNYRDCVLKAVNLGGDTDTIAALAGALAGAAYGLEGIPEEWIETLRSKEMIDECLFEVE